MGGRGASSGLRSLKINNLFGPNGGAIGKIQQLDPNEFRKEMKKGDQSSGLEAFERLHKNSNIEYGVSIGQNGKVYEYNKGTKSSVGFMKDNVGGKVLVMHNHPSGLGIPSVKDLETMDSWKQVKTSAIFGKNVSSIITKTQSNKTGNMSNMISEYSKAMNKGASRNQLIGILKTYQTQGKYKIDIK